MIFIYWRGEEAADVSLASTATFVSPTLHRISRYTSTLVTTLDVLQLSILIRLAAQVLQVLLSGGRRVLNFPTVSSTNSILFLYSRWIS